MPDSEPSLHRTVIEGGVLMGPFLVVALIWIGTTLAYFFRRNRSVKHLVSLLVFPLHDPDRVGPDRLSSS